MKTIFVISKRPVTTACIPSELMGVVPLIKEREVIKRTEKGYRLSVSYARNKGSMYLDEHYAFFSTYESALKFIAAEANKVAGELEQLQLKAVQLMCQAHDELNIVRGRGIASSAPVGGISSDIGRRKLIQKYTEKYNAKHG
ncbi:hypothetical protein ABVK36_11130 [Lonsdalea quercina]|uniref:hypothetical protein n=1 Tax=Lonsdalea quercina TaxID=71657 RepID=UPI003F466FAF